MGTRRGRAADGSRQDDAGPGDQGRSAFGNPDRSRQLSDRPCRAGPCLPLSCPYRGRWCDSFSDGYLAHHATPNATVETPGVTATLEAQIAGLREVGELLRHQLDDVRRRSRSVASSGRAVGPGRPHNVPGPGASCRPAALVETVRRLGAMFTVGSPS